ncbi:hypothetical protein AVEN_45214-1 [Araneus ventricosus]|uniref:Uncharacterized protein n=1 Tax=Araneus ventricosus TaxID=182803 RepID=A0A4Y2VLR1_ARAVE|nr:hypothetical protein AVEN_45214-1 [Araneus ventricosus]
MVGMDHIIFNRDQISWKTLEPALLSQTSKAATPTGDQTLDVFSVHQNHAHYRKQDLLLASDGKTKSLLRRQSFINIGLISMFFMTYGSLCHLDISSMVGMDHIIFKRDQITWKTLEPSLLSETSKAAIPTGEHRTLDVFSIHQNHVHYRKQGLLPASGRKTKSLLRGQSFMNIGPISIFLCHMEAYVINGRDGPHNFQTGPDNLENT